MKLMKKIISCIIVACIVVSVLPITALAQTESSVIDSGSCGDNLRWSLSDTTLTISGTGKMNDYWTSSVVSWSRYCSNITNVIIEDGATSIGSYAFYECPNLTNIIIPDSVIIIGSNAFNACSSLSCVNIPNNVIEIGDYAFYECSSLTEIIIPSKITIVENGVFSRCDNLVSVTLPDGLCSIESGAFEYCDKLFYINIPDSVTSIGYAAFQGCNNLTNITIPEGVTRIGGNTFQWCNLANIVIPDSVTYIGDRAFWECTNLNNITIPNSVTHIDEFAFYDCRKVTSIIVPNGITAIEKGTFQSCDNLSSIAIPESVSEIRWGAFDGCDNLRDVYYSGSKDQWKMISIQDGNTDLLSAVIHYGENAIPDNTSMSTENSTHAVTSNTSWNQLYYDFIVSDKQTSDFALYGDWQDAVDYEVIYLNSDEIPELWITYVVAATGVESRLLSYSNGQISNEMLGNVQLNYEKYNAVIDAQHMGGGFWSNTIYRLGTDGLTKIAYGSYDYFDQNGNFTTDLTYKWDTSVITEDQYNINLSKWVNPSTAISTKSADSVIYDYPSILDYLSSVVVEDDNISFDETPSVIPEVEIQARNEWINQHLEYAASDEYRSEIVSGYNGRMLAVFRDALDDGGIGNYRLAKTTSKLLGLDFDLSESEMYELILAEIMYSRAGLNMGQEAYEENLYNAVIDVAKLLVNVANGAENSSKIPKDTLNSINELYSMLSTLSMDATDFDSTYSQFIKLIKENVSEPDLIKGFKRDATFTAIGIVVDGLFEVYESLEDILQYMNNYIAYQSTSQQLKEVLMRLSVVVLYEYEGLYGVEELEELGVWGAMVNWSEFSTAIISYVTVLTDYEQEGAASVATYAVERSKEAGQKFGDKALKSVVVFGLDTIASQIPVLNAIVLAKNVLNVGVVVTEILTNVDEREYALDMLTKIYCISVALDKVVDDCASAMSEDDFYSSTVFDESVNIYSGAQLLASDFALKYADMVLKNAETDLKEYDNHRGIDHLFTSRDKMIAVVEWYSNSYKLLEEQQAEIQAIACHDSGLRYDPLTDDVIYNFKDSRMYIVACPVEVIVTTDTGEQIAYLSGAENQIASGYDFYFHTIKLTDDSDEYIKVAVVPEMYQIEIRGTGDGMMNAYVADFSAGEIGEVETYFNIPVEKDSVGYFESNINGTNESSLVMDQVIYSSMESAEDIPHDSNNKTIWILSIGSLAIIVGISVIIFIFKRRNYKPRYLK